jgi:hypothetical protein
VRVVEGSEIYNFPIHTLVHFSCKKLSFYRSNKASPKQFRADATSPAPPRAGARPSAFEPPGLRLEAALPQATRPPRPPRSLAPSSHRAPTGRRTPNGPPVRSMPPAVRSSRGRRLLLEALPSDPQSLASTQAAIKGSLPPVHRAKPRPRAPLVPATGAAAARYHHRPAARQTKVASTLPCPYSRPPTSPSRQRDPYLAGTPAAAATTAGRRCTPRRRPPLLPNPNQIGP